MRLEERQKARIQTFKRWVRTLFVRAAGIGILAFAVQFSFNSDTRARYDHLKDEVARMRGLNEDMMAENERLRLQIDGIRHDDRYLEQVARQEFSMIRDGEILYKFPQPTAPMPQAPPQATSPLD